MSEQEHERPLTRREMRLREQAEREGVDSIEDIVASEEAAAAEGAVVAEPSAVDLGSIEIDPLNPDGTPRTRREMRELREAAAAELLAAQRDEDQADEDPVEEPASDVGKADATEADAAEADTPEALLTPDDSYGAPTEALSLEDLPQAGASEAAEGEVEPELDAPTEAFTLEEMLDAAEPKSPTGDAEAVANLFATEPNAIIDVDADIADIDEAEAVEAEAVEVVETVEPVEAAEPVEEPVVEVVEEIDVELVAEDLNASAIEVEAEAEVEADEEADRDAGTDTGTDTAGYSFPDIQPPEEWRSVFDDPSRAANISAPGDSGDFDDLISRAVAQEGSTGGTGASALILPSHPGDTGGLTGPLGATGELFVTGSIELPKSMGETGGHSGIHDSIDFDPFLSGEAPGSIASSTESGPMPVSALSAVSARRRPEVPVVAEPTKDRSKMPLILALSGGGLIVVVIGVVVFAATQGFFN
ncbi:hypothetical protein FB468_0319 [Leucobacter komagatae]|uniref:Uncharacterized protein n=1 Tax=Leucobacter komagatae TaxID=55969 RepID=A0A542Y2M5_9MICO|nr:hypothetical protein [Leucobacter komagatae]TQL42332.1 hypothetical protein FB468_0319 [Leucobacter komagatae]